MSLQYMYFCTVLEVMMMMINNILERAESI
jgi:hypothetical protein